MSTPRAVIDNVVCPHRDAGPGGQREEARRAAEGGAGAGGPRPVHQEDAHLFRRAVVHGADQRGPRGAAVKVFAVLADLGCGMADARARTHRGHLGCVAFLRGAEPDARILARSWPWTAGRSAGARWSPCAAANRSTSTSAAAPRSPAWPRGARPWPPRLTRRRPRPPPWPPPRPPAGQPAPAPSPPPPPP